MPVCPESSGEMVLLSSNDKIKAAAAAGALTYLASEAVSQILPTLDPVAMLRSVMVRHSLGLHELPEESTHYWVSSEGAVARSLAMSGGVAMDDGLKEIARGTKIINGNLGNIERGLPGAQGLILLHDPVTSWPSVILEAAQISAARTAAVAALSAGLLANGT